MIHPDRRNNLNPAEVVKTAYDVIDTLQHHPKATAPVAAAIVVLSIANTLRLDISELFDKARRVLKDADTPFQREAAAMEQYIREELS